MNSGNSKTSKTLQQLGFMWIQVKVKGKRELFTSSIDSRNSEFVRKYWKNVQPEVGDEASACWTTSVKLKAKIEFWMLEAKMLHQQHECYKFVLSEKNFFDWISTRHE